MRAVRSVGEVDDKDYQAKDPLEAALDQPAPTSELSEALNRLLHAIKHPNALLEHTS